MRRSLRPADFRSLAPVLAGLLLGTSLAAASDPLDEVRRSRELYGAAAAALAEGDTLRHLEILDEAVTLRPGHPTLVFHRAAARCLNGNAAGARDDLDLLARMGLTLDPGEDPRFASLVGESRFEAIRAHLQRNGVSPGAATGAFTLPGPDLVPEGIAHDPETGRFFVSSVHRGIILSVEGDSTGVRLSAWEGRWSILGIVADPVRRRLWGVSSALPQAADFDSTVAGRTALLGYDLDSGRLEVVATPSDSLDHEFGDLTLAPDGTLVIADGGARGLLRYDPGSEAFSYLAPPGSFASPQGLAFSEDGTVLHVADYSRGVLAIDPATGDMDLLSAPEDVTLLGIDGLARHRGSLVAVQNGITPHRVVRILLTPTGDAIREVEVLEAAHPAFEEPTLGVVVGDEFYFVANSQWNRFSPDGALQTDPPLEDPRILRLSLERP